MPNYFSLLNSWDRTTAQHKTWQNPPALRYTLPSVRYTPSISIARNVFQRTTVLSYFFFLARRSAVQILFWMASQEKGKSKRLCFHTFFFPKLVLFILKYIWNGENHWKLLRAASHLHPGVDNMARSKIFMSPVEDQCSQNHVCTLSVQVY